MSATLVWFQRDLRLHDHAALGAAVKRGAPIIPVFIDDEAAEGNWPLGGASRWWLHHSLAALGESLRSRGLRLILARGPAGAVLGDLVRQTNATAVYWNRRPEPAARAWHATVTARLTAGGIEAASFDATLLFEPDAGRNKAGKPFQVFTPYWRHCLTLEVDPPVKLKRGPLAAPAKWPASLDLAELGLLPDHRWADGWPARWQPGEAGAMRRLRRFVAGAMDAYAAQRNSPEVDGTSVLSPHLHFGEISPRQIWAAVRRVGKDTGLFPPSRGAQVFLSEIGWREFAHHLLLNFPHTPEEPLRAEFAAFPWSRNAAHLAAWQQGRTGYPIVDAGMRQLWQTGWMHNRVRMIVASFLVKHLRLSWREGAAWFWNTLVDADLANNTLGWQWSAGCGADAAPYFRIFNPMLQGAKFDPAGRYTRRWVPELAKVPTRFLHCPWEAPADVLDRAGVCLGRDYPRPVVDHPAARAAALAALKSIRKHPMAG